MNKQIILKYVNKINNEKKSLHKTFFTGGAGYRGYEGNK